MTEYYTKAQIDAIATQIGNRMAAERRPEFVEQFGGQFLLDPNEVNGWGILGFIDNTNSQDLGNFGANLNRSAGGFSFPWDVKLKRLYVRYQMSNANAQAWGWVIARQAKNAGSNTVTTTYILDEATANGGVGPNNPGNTRNQLSDITIDHTIPAGEVVVLGVAAPTANTTNYYVRVQSGYFLFERVT